MQKKHKLSYPIILIGMIILGIAIGSFRIRAVEAASEPTYLIRINKQQNCVTIYKKGNDGKYTVPVKAMICSTGSATPTGTYKTLAKYRWKLLLDNVWGQYSTRIVGGILFHSVWYYKQDPSTLSATQYNKLGTMCSHGCVRLTVADAKWIYDNCTIGTQVIVYNDSTPGPLGKPVAQKLKAGTGWDPTDPDKNNPFHSEQPSIDGATTRWIAWGSTFDPLAGVTARSSFGEDITKNIQVTGTVDVKKEGKYKITYQVTDVVNKEAKVTITIGVRPKPMDVSIEGVQDRVIAKKTKVTRKFCLNGVKAYEGNTAIASNHIQVDIQTKQDRYIVTYTVASKGTGTVSQTAEFYIDSQPPVLTADDVYYKGNVTIDRAYALEYVTVSDDFSDLTKRDIDVDIDKTSENVATVTLWVSDGVGNITTKTVQFIRQSDVVIVGAVNGTVAEGIVVDEAFVMRGVTGWDGNKNITKRMTVTISEPENNRYTVTYELTNATGDTAKVVVSITIVSADE